MRTPAICAHRLTYPTREISFISYRAESTPQNRFAQVIHCCSEHSQYDPAEGAKVVAGPAPQPLAAILLDYDARSDGLYAVGTLGGELFNEFFEKYAFRLALDHNGRARAEVEGNCVVSEADAILQATGQMLGNVRTRSRAPKMIPWLEADTPFPPVQTALKHPNGLLAAGGDLSPERLLAGYRLGIFPWFSEGDPILWWSPDPRMVLIPEELKIGRSLAKALRNRAYEIRFDSAFADTLAGCAAPRKDQSGTWITEAMSEAYLDLHRLGHAHSVETWIAGELAGGLYGVALGDVFFGESMFSRARDASKLALVALARHLDAGRIPPDRLPDAHRASGDARRAAHSAPAVFTTAPRVDTLFA